MAQQYSRYIAWTGGLALMVFGILTVKESKSASMTLPKSMPSAIPTLLGY